MVHRSHDEDVADEEAEEEDGRVEAEAEGEKAKVEIFARWCEHGPRGAAVEWVDATWGAPRGQTQGFRIVR